MVMHYWVRREIAPNEKPKWNFSKSDVLAECVHDISTSETGTISRLASTIAINTRLRVIGQTMTNEPTADDIRVMMSRESTMRPEEVVQKLREEVLPEAIEKRIGAYNKAYVKAAKLGSFLAAQTMRFALLFAVGDIITKTIEIIHGKVEHILDFGVKGLIGGAIALYIAKKLIPPVTKHISRMHSEHTIDVIEETIAKASHLFKLETRMRIFKAVNTSCPQITTEMAVREYFDAARKGLTLYLDGK